MTNPVTGVVGGIYPTLAALTSNSGGAIFRAGQVVSVFALADRGDYYIEDTDRGDGNAISGTVPQLYANKSSGGGGMFLVSSNELNNVNLSTALSVGDEVLNIQGTGRLTALRVNSTTGVAEISLVADGTRTIFTGAPSAGGFDKNTIGVISGNGSGDDSIVFTQSLVITVTAVATTDRTLTVKYQLGEIV